MKRIFEEPIISMDELEQLCSKERRKKDMKVSEKKIFKVYLVCSDDEHVNKFKERYPFLIWKKEEKLSIFDNIKHITNICEQKLSWKELKQLEKDGVVDTETCLQHTSIFLNRYSYAKKDIN